VVLFEPGQDTGVAEALAELETVDEVDDPVDVVIAEVVAVLDSEELVTELPLEIAEEEVAEDEVADTSLAPYTPLYTGEPTDDFM